jgi:SpoVK/Ycf46/Vps4 family AAA+-type ATPase
MFEVAEKWKALLLLDEADDFLCRRSHDSNHNSLVSVFLRKLEYYKGIMLLTTNRVRDFDEAVQSRIHVGIKYSPLGVDTRKAIWRSFLEKAKTETGDAVYSDKQLNDLAKHSLNGRQASVPSTVEWVPLLTLSHRLRTQCVQHMP